MGSAEAFGVAAAAAEGGGADQDIRKVTIEWNDAQNSEACLKSEAGRTQP